MEKRKDPIFEVAQNTALGMSSLGKAINGGLRGIHRQNAGMRSSGYLDRLLP